nr:unnamed protein product [Callosobruchus analis]
MSSKFKKNSFVKIFETKLEIESCEAGDIKQGLIADLLFHKKRSKTFHTLMKDNPEASVTYVFDLQQVLFFL